MRSALLLLLVLVAAPVSAQRAPQRFATPVATYAARPSQRPVPERGDARLILTGALGGAAVGWLVGWSAAAAGETLMERDGSVDETRLQLLALLPPALGGAGAATGALRASCSRFDFGRLRDLDGCGAVVPAGLAVLPGAVVGYALTRDSTRLRHVVIGIALQSAGAALAATLVRVERPDH